ncbi:hypothetical transmembrane protein [Neisseria lactamica 020-06]|uniref:Hypothetical transmembrane protein n=1 Tax=Neisseria lactamica (strain 020-06) TaxID=489653 RepID=E4ZA91_NEIL0|nr:hypothetical transmembrane protein [Neisseria lactamica 020-06]
MSVQNLGASSRFSDGLKQRRQPVNKRKTKNRQARAARPAVSVRWAKPLEKLSEKLFAIGMVTAFAALVSLTCPSSSISIFCWRWERCQLGWR